MIYEMLDIIREVGTHHFWIGTHQNLVGLTIFKSDESRDSPFQNLSENPGYRSFKPSNAILLALIPWCPINAVPLLENCVIFSLFSGGIFSIFLSNFTNFSNNFEMLLS